MKEGSTNEMKRGGGAISRKGKMACSQELGGGIKGGGERVERIKQVSQSAVKSDERERIPTGEMGGFVQEPESQ